MNSSIQKPSVDAWPRPGAWADRNRHVVDLLVRGEIKAALAEATEVDRLAANGLPDSDPERAKAVYNLASLQQRSGELLEAEKSFERALKAIAAAFGPKHTIYARTLGAFARLKVELRRFDAAEALFVTAIYLYSHQPKACDSELATELQELAALHETMARELPVEAKLAEAQTAGDGRGEAHFERSPQVQAMRAEALAYPPELRDFAMHDLDRARQRFGHLSTHTEALAIYRRHVDQGEPFALLLRGFATEAQSWVAKARQGQDWAHEDPAQAPGGPGIGLNMQQDVGEVESRICPQLKVCLPVIAVAAPASLDPGQGSQGAQVPRLILADDSWLVDVQCLIRAAHLVVVDALALTPGLRRELDAIRQARRCESTVVFLYRDKSKVEAQQSIEEALNFVATGVHQSLPAPEWLTRDHGVMAPFRRITYVDDFPVQELATSEVLGDLISTVPLARSANRMAAKGVTLANAGKPLEAMQYFWASMCASRWLPGWCGRPFVLFNYARLCIALELREAALKDLIDPALKC